VTGEDLNVQDPGTAKAGDRVSGGSDPSDSMNTSQGGQGATMGVNNQMFNAGNTAVFTLVEGFDPLGSGPDATGDNVTQIDYDGYTDTSGAEIFISQTQGNGTVNLTIELFEAGGAGGTPEEGFAYIGAEGGNDGHSGAFTDDTPVDVATVVVLDDLGAEVGTWGVGGSTSGTVIDGVKITIAGNSIQVEGILAEYTVSWTVPDDETFNRFHVTGDTGTETFDIGRVSIAEGVTVTTPVGDDLFVDDDGPTVTADGTVPTLVTDDTLVDVPDTDTASFAGIFQVAFGTDGAKDADNDGTVDTDAVTYALGVKSEGVFSGLVDTISGDKIYLFLESGVVVGRVGLDNDGGFDDEGEIAFTISVAADGNVTQTQLRSVVHDDPDDPEETGASAATLAAADLVTLTATATDDDLDEDSGPKNIGDAFKFEDDGPSIERSATAVPTLTTDDTAIPGSDGPTDFSVLFDTDFGKDGFKDADDDDAEDADAVTYALGVKDVNGVDSGLVDTLTGNSIFLYLDGAVVNGRVGNDNGTANAAGLVAFSISVDADTGEVTLEQDRAVVHDDPDDPVESGASAATLAAADLVTLTATATDGDGDTAEATADIGLSLAFEDDGPAITAQIEGGVVDFADADSLTSSLNGDVGSDENAIDDEALDGTKTYTFDSFNIVSTSITGLTGEIVEDGTRVVFFTDGVGGTAGSYDEGVDTLWFDNLLNQDANSGAGSYTFTVQQPPPAQFIEFDFTDLPANQSLFGLIAADKAELGEGDLGLAIVPTGASLKADGTYVTGGAAKSNTINTSKGGGPVTIAVSNQLFDKPGEGAYFVYITDPDDDAVAGVGTGLSTAYDDADNLGFGGTHELDTASYEIVQNSTSAKSRVTAYDIDPGRVGDLATDDTTSRAFILDPDATADTVSITAVRVYDSANNLLESVLNVGGTAILQDINNDGTSTPPTTTPPWPSPSSATATAPTAPTPRSRRRTPATGSNSTRRLRTTWPWFHGSPASSTSAVSTSPRARTPRTRSSSSR